jgi:hypothetical protein
MKQKLLALFSFIILMTVFRVSTFAQVELVNYEETWQKFLKEPLTSAVSKLTQPEKSNSIDYLKYCLMYATSYFCADNLKDAKLMMEEINKIGTTEHSKISGFKERYEELGKKIEAYYQVGELWTTFMANKNVGLEDLNKIPAGKTVCEKGTLAKYFYISAYANYCAGNFSATKTDFENKVLSLVEKANFDPKNVAGLPEEIKFMKEIIRVNNLLDIAWAEYMKTNVSPGFKDDLEQVKCNLIPNMKIYVLRAMADVCKNGNQMLKKIKELQAINTQTIPADLQKKIDWLDAEVSKYNGNLADLNKAWQEFVSTNNVDKNLNYKGIFCEKDAQVKSLLIEGTLEYCTKGEEKLTEIDKVIKEFNPTLDQTTKDKITKLRALVKKENENVASFNKAWEEFSTNDTIITNTSFPFEYCSKEMLARAYIMDGRLGICSRADSRLADLLKLKKSGNFEGFSELTLNKFADFEIRANKVKSDNEHLNNLWSTFVNNKDTIEGEYSFVDKYCDKIMQVKSWCLLGHYNTCERGQQYLSKIDEFQKEHNLVFDTELACRVTRLRIKVWDCRYWELVEKAWVMTHAEREDFGPKSAQVMYKDLNGPKQVCETKVEYEPLGKIGIKYTVKIYLCQNVDLAKMGDPEYYKKIAKWIDTEVLVKYCSPDFRCKKDFNLYIEGHTDGNPMGYHKYTESFNIPKGTPYTHFIGTKDTIEKVLDKTITYELKTNMELGLGRAWTVKKQLDFIGAPVTIGAYEHPAEEKGGEFRRMEVELFMPNLLLDFFEARLKELLEASGIGPQPKQCKG